MPRPQFTLRALLVAMLVVAVVVWGYAQARRSAQLTSIANDAELTAQQLRASASLESRLLADQRHSWGASEQPWLAVDEDEPAPRWNR